MKIKLLFLAIPMLVQPFEVIANPQDVLIHPRAIQSDDETPNKIQCGQIQVCGSEQLTQTELCHLLDRVSQNPFDSESRNSAQASLTREYHRRGYLEASFSWNDAEKNAEISHHNVCFIVHEGPIYHLRRLEMMGNENTRDRIIRRRVALQEGTAFDEELLELSIKRINQLGIFEEFTREDVAVRVNKKGHFVDLTFRLREK